MRKRLFNYSFYSHPEIGKFQGVTGSNRENNSFVFLFGCLAWGLWLTRNDLIFNNIVASTPDVGVLRMISFM
jgi:hypothetical protein